MSVRTAPAPPVEPGRYHWTVDTFYRAMNAGIFDEPNRLELVNGELWEREAMNPPHAATARRIARLLRRMFEPTFLVMEEKPFHIAEDGEPRPDVCVVAGSDEDFEDRHPTAAEVRLIVEVTHTTVERDTVEKTALYAQAGIEDYWVVLINREELLVYRRPRPDGYPEPQRFRAGDTVAPLFAPDVTIAVADLLPRSTQ